jgi:hypothetical protein
VNKKVENIEKGFLLLFFIISDPQSFNLMRDVEVLDSLMGCGLGNICAKAER